MSFEDAHSYPVTNIRNTSSPHWRGWLKPENRGLVPFNSFAEYSPERQSRTRRPFTVHTAQEEIAAYQDGEETK